MKNFGAKWLALAMVVGVGASMSLNGCGDGPTPSPIAGTNGGAGRGGTTGTAGTGGGSAGRGGTTGSAGRGGTGGSTAGTTGTAGGGAGGGAVGGMTGCAALVGFDTGLEGFAHNMYNTGATNIYLVGLDGGTPATLVHDTSMGSPTLGSMKSESPFSDYKQFIDLQKGYPTTGLQNWTGFKLHVRVRIASGLNQDPAFPAGIQPYASSFNTTASGDYHFNGTYTNVVAGNGWNDYVFDLAKPATDFDPSKIVNFGVLIQSGDGSATAAKPTAAVIYVDSFWLEGSCGGTGGTGGGTAGAGGATAGAGGGTAGATAGAGGGTAGATAGAGGGTAGATAGAGGGTAGATAGAGGGTAGATAGTGGGTAGATAGTGGGTAGATGTGGGTGGAALTTLFDFEAGVQTWATSSAGASVAASTEQHFDGVQSLKLTHGALDNANILATVNISSLWPGTVLTFHAFLPAGFDTTGAHYFQAITQSNNYKVFDSAGNGARTATAGAWNTWTYTVPNTFPGGLNQLGFQLGDGTGGATLPAGSVYLDAITATGGTQNCAVAVGTGAHTFEAALDANVYQKDGSDADTVATQSTDRANLGTGSWKVAFTALPAPASGAMTSRRVFINGPNIYCGQTATVHVYLPAGSDGLTFQAFAQYNNYAQFGAAGPATVTRDGWNTYAYTIPSDVGPGGIQRFGVQLIWAGTTAFTGNVYIDDVTW